MEKKTGTSTATTAYGKKLDTPLEYEYVWTAYQTDEELVAAKDEMTLEEQRKSRNNERQANSRQKALQKKLDDAGIVKPTAENDPQIALRDMFKTLSAVRNPDGTRKFTDEQARQVASMTLSIEWASE